MKIRIGIEEAESGKHKLRLPEDKLFELKQHVLGKRPIVLRSPVQVNGKRCAVVIPTELNPAEEKFHELKFKPLWVRCFQLCEARTNRLRLLVCEFEDKKITFDEDGYRQCSYTTAGAGVGDNAADEAELLLAKLLSGKEVGDPVVQRVVSYLQNSSVQP